MASMDIYVRPLLSAPTTAKVGCLWLHKPGVEADGETSGCLHCPGFFESMGILIDLDGQE